MKTRWPALILLSGGASGILAFTGALPGLRAFVVLPFLLIGPGMAWIRLLELDSGLAELTLAVALSAVLATAVAGGMLYAGAWSPHGSLVILLGLTVVALVLEKTRGNQRRNRTERDS